MTELEIILLYGIGTIILLYTFFEFHKILHK